MAGRDGPGAAGTRQPTSRHKWRHERPRPVTRQQKGARWWTIGALVVTLALAGGGYYAVAQKGSGAVAHKDSAPRPGTAIDGIHCGPMEGRAEHIHAHVALFWNGKPVTIPAFVGIPVNPNIAGNVCFYWLHTHATTGVIHVEAPVRGTYTLGQFFDVWRDTAQWDRQGAILQAPHVDDAFPNALRPAPAKDVHVYVGSTPVDMPYRDVTLANHKNITIELGAPLKPPVATYDWAHWKGL